MHGPQPKANCSLTPNPESHHSSLNCQSRPSEGLAVGAGTHKAAASPYALPRLAKVDVVADDSEKMVINTLIGCKRARGVWSWY